MAIRSLNDFIPVQLDKNDGTVNAGGTLEFFAPPGFTTPTDVYAEAALTTNLGDTITLDAAGRWLATEIWLPAAVNIRCKDSAGNTLWPLAGVNSDPSASATTSGGNLVTNGSFETDTNGDNLPDGWTLTSYTGSTNTLDNTTQADGINSLKSTSAGNGGGTWLHDAYIEVDGLNYLGADFSLKASVANVRIIVELLWYDASKVQLGGGSAATTLYDDSATNPLVWTHKSVGVTPPAAARYVRPRVRLCDPSVATAGSAWCDAVNVHVQSIAFPASVLSNAMVAALGRFQIFTVGGTPFIPPKTGNYLVLCIGGGGGGGGGAGVPSGVGNQYGPSGNAGAAGEMKWAIVALTAGVTEAITIGTAGTKGTGGAAQGAAGSDGGATTFGTTVTVTAAGGKGGRASGYQIAGGAGSVLGASGPNGGGYGGGQGGLPSSTNTAGNPGSAATGPGAGGGAGGGAATQGAGAYNGGNGGDGMTGLIIVFW